MKQNLGVNKVKIKIYLWNSSVLFHPYLSFTIFYWRKEEMGKKWHQIPLWKCVFSVPENTLFSFSAGAFSPPGPQDLGALPPWPQLGVDPHTHFYFLLKPFYFKSYWKPCFVMLTKLKIYTIHFFLNQCSSITHFLTTYLDSHPVKKNVDKRFRSTGYSLDLKGFQKWTHVNSTSVRKNVGFTLQSPNTDLCILYVIVSHSCIIQSLVV